MVIIASGNYFGYKDLFTGPMAVARAVTNRTIDFHIDFHTVSMPATRDGA